MKIATPTQTAAEVVEEANRALREPEVPTHPKSLLDEIVDADLRDYQEQHLRTFLRLLSEDHGCSTPWQEFLVGLINLAAVRVLTPDEVANELDTFRDNWQTGIRDAALVLRDYPAEMKAELAELLAAQ